MFNKSSDLTAEQYFKLRCRLSKQFITSCIIFFILSIFIVLYLFLSNNGLLLRFNIAWYGAAAVFFTCLNLVFSMPKAILGKGRRGIQFHSQWLSMCYERFPAALKKTLSHYCSKRSDMHPDDALLHLVNNLNLLSYLFLLTAVICFFTAYYLFSQNWYSLCFSMYYNHVFEKIIASRVCLPSYLYF